MTGTVTVGKLLGGRYRIEKLIGEGGFGAVYKANDERFQATRVVALKEMSDANLSESERERALKDFRREANLLVQLNHSNLPQVSDFFEEGTKAYLVMEVIEGKTLEQVLEDADGPLDEALVIGWALQLCSVLQYLHSRQPPIIFRDMKPSNVMVTGDNQLKLIDFGIARIFKASATKDTTLLGSQGYAPLEQYGRSQSDPRSDIYALGATMYHLLTGNVPADAPLVASINTFSSLHANSISISHRKPRKLCSWPWSRTPMSDFSLQKRCGKPFSLKRRRKSPLLLTQRDYHRELL